MPELSPGEPRSGRLRSIDLKLVVVLAATLAVLFAGLAALSFGALDRLLGITAQETVLLKQLNERLRANVLDLQDRYLQVPRLLEADPARLVSSWAADSYPVEERSLEGRDAIVERFRKREARRDIQRPGRVVVDAIDGGAAISYGHFDGDTFLDRVTELRLAGADPDAVTAEVARIADEAGSGKLLQRRIAELTARLADEALAAERVRTEFLDQVGAIAGAEAAVESTAASIRTAGLALGGLALLVAVAAVCLVARLLVTRPLVRLAGAAHAIADGRVVSVPHVGRSDEIGAIARGIDAFGESRRRNQELRREQAEREALAAEEKHRSLERMAEQIEREFHSAGAAVAEDARHMLSVAESLLGMFDGMLEQTEGASSLARVSRRDAEAVRDATGAMAGEITAIAGRMSEADRAARRAAETASTMRTVIERQSAAAESITGIVDIIGAIAGQTQMLALNATIEAARAGEAGRGFAVVAGEVKALANQTQQSVQRITEQVAGIRSVSDEVASSIEAVAGLITAISGSNAAIAAAMEDQSRATREIADTVGRAATGSETVADRIGAVSASSAELRRVSGEIAERSRGLGQRIDALQSTVNGIVRASVGAVGQVAAAE